MTISCALACAIAGCLLLLFRHLSTFERAEALEGLTSTVLWLAASVIGCCGTIAALMLTTVGLMEHLETRRLTPRFLQLLQLVVTSAIATIAVSVITLIFTVFPVTTGTDSTPDALRVKFLYWSLLVGTVAIIGGFGLVLGSLYMTVKEIFRTLPREWVEEILIEEENAEDSRDRTPAGTAS